MSFGCGQEHDVHQPPPSQSDRVLLAVAPVRTATKHSIPASVTSVSSSRGHIGRIAGSSRILLMTERTLRRRALTSFSRMPREMLFLSHTNLIGESALPWCQRLCKVFAHFSRPSRTLGSKELWKLLKHPGLCMPWLSFQISYHFKLLPDDVAHQSAE